MQHSTASPVSAGTSPKLFKFFFYDVDKGIGGQLK
jgi:hypothetical protein